MDLKVLVVDPKNQDPQKYAEKGDKSKMIWGSKSTNALELKNLIFLNGASVKSYHSGYIRETINIHSDLLTIKVDIAKSGGKFLHRSQKRRSSRHELNEFLEVEDFIMTINEPKFIKSNYNRKALYDQAVN